MLNISSKFIFELKNVSFLYREDLILSNLSLQFKEGESVILLGANGSGKSTLLKLLGGLLYPIKGTILFQGNEVSKKSLLYENFGIYFRASVGILFQNSESQLFNPTVEEEIAYGPIQLKDNLEHTAELVRESMVDLNIEHLATRSPFSLSGGEMRKVALASILVMKPEVLLLDEPTSGLDPKSIRKVKEILLEYKSKGKTIIVATHELNFALEISERAIVFNEDHQIIFDGPSDELLLRKDILESANLI